MTKQSFISILKKRIDLTCKNILEHEDVFATYKLSILFDYLDRVSNYNWSKSQAISKLSEELVVAQRTSPIVPVVPLDNHHNELFTYYSTYENYSFRAAKLLELPNLLALLSSIPRPEHDLDPANDTNTEKVRSLDG